MSATRGPVADLDPLAIWGAFLSSVLAAVKIWEVWRSRTRIEFAYNLGDAEQGNEVTVFNLSATPIQITYWELLWRHRRWGRWKQSRSMEPPEYWTGRNAEGHSSATLKFIGDQYFDWEPRALGSDRIYIRLHIAGRKRPILRNLYPPRRSF
jgi:hypothetical protein